MRADLFRQAAVAPETVFGRYEKYQREYKDSVRACEVAGFRFVPIVFEAHAGGWSAAARGVLDWVARQAAASQQEEPHAVSLRIAQRISCTRHREKAHTVLRRSTAAASSTQPHPIADGDADDNGFTTTSPYNLHKITMSSQ